ncbi:MAG: Nif3-like dinuclear metal center hexameric protein [Lachnospiraceae bacterium]|nr:Nif3-like dinuclear metal center hexameric protein [Lachnospiraceae bacterium]
MKCKDIMVELKNRWPEHLALDWDNVGLLVGDEDQEVHHIFVALDVTDDTLAQAIGCGADLIITHHPLLFSPKKRVVASDFIGKRIITMIKNNISYYAMHTNFDVAGMANLNAECLALESPSVLDVTYSDECGKEEGIGRVGLLHEPVRLDQFGAYAKKCLGLSMVRVYGDSGKKIQKVAISSGSGKSMIGAAIAAGAEVLVTGDIDYHTGIDAVAQGLMLVDAGHYGTEMIFIEYMEKKLKELFPGIPVTAAEIEQPFQLV